MKITRRFELTKNDIRSAIVGYIEDLDFVDKIYFFENFEVVATDDDNHVIRINMNEGLQGTNVQCIIKACKTQ